MAKDTQISAHIPRKLKDDLDAFTREKGLKQGWVIEQALQSYIVAVRVVPPAMLVPNEITLSRKSFERVIEAIKAPATPTEALRKLMRGETVSDDALHPAT